MSTPTNPPAFPQPIASNDFAHSTDSVRAGMTLLDYFAGQALAGYLDNDTPPGAASLAYQAAEAMMAERAKRAENQETS